MRQAWGVRVGVLCMAGAVGAVGVLSSRAQTAAAPAASQEAVKEVGIRGVVARGAAEGSCAIKVSFGAKKVISYEVAPESPKAKDFVPLIGKTVEATGVMKKGSHGENLFVVSAVEEVVARK
ncbi:MAG: hypothetical protein HZB55_16895 [Deltaproteobacteria bacterium]|nr:hypothetical protein [Deltaproteobacteria bacterium]